MVAFVVSIVILLLVSKRSMTIGIFTAALFLGILTMSLMELITVILNVFLNKEYLLLATAVAMIPVIGGLLNVTGLLDSMIKNFKFGKKALLMFSPAILGLLPMPGGALFSAPMVEKTTSELSNVRKASINVWYRHILHLIYPLATALIIGAELAGIGTFVAVIYQAPLFIISLTFGYAFFLGKLRDNDDPRDASWIAFLKPLLIVLLAPAVDISLKLLLNLKYLATLIGVLSSLILTIALSKVDFKTLKDVSKKSRFWDFFLLILAIYVYQNVFIRSDVPYLLKRISFSPYLLLIVAGFALGFLTGRVSTPLIILIPIYLVKFGFMDPVSFAMMYYSTLLGYIMSPVHPCLVFTAQYFRVDSKKVIADLLAPTLASLVIGILLLFLLSLL